MQTDIFPGAWYGAGLPNREYCVVYVPSYKLEWNGSPVPNPTTDTIDKLDIAPGKFGGMGRADGPPRVWEWDGHVWKDTEVPTGRFCYGPQGGLYDMAPAGVGFIREDGRIYDRTQTYEPHNGVSNWIEWREFLIGQAHDDAIGGAVVYYNGKLLRLDDGNVNEFRFHSQDDSFCLMYRKDGVGVIRKIGTGNDLVKLAEATKPVVVVVPPVIPEKLPVADHPNYLLTVQAIRSNYPTPLGDKHAQFLAQLAQAIPGSGLLKKSGGTVITMPDGTTVAQDIIMFQEDSRIYDILGDGENVATPGWGEANGSPADPGRFYPVSGNVVNPPEPTGGHGLTEDQVKQIVREVTQDVYFDVHEIKFELEHIKDVISANANADHQLWADIATRVASIEQRLSHPIDTTYTGKSIFSHNHKVTL